MSTKPPLKLTPMMEQWHSCKAKAKDALLLFRMGDFYEAFYEDARIIATELELTLTQRQGIPMSGIPWHTCDGYLDKLVLRGHKVAIAEQIENPKEAKGLVERAIVRIVTPGTLVSASLVGSTSNHFIVAIAQVGSVFGVASCDITTANFKVVELENLEELAAELHRLSPSEFVVAKKFREKHSLFLKDFEKIPMTLLEEWHFDHQRAYSALTRHFQVPHLDGFGLRGSTAAINGAGALLNYLQEELALPVIHLRSLKSYSTKEILNMDKACQLNLELTEQLQGRMRPSTLLWVLDQTVTPMGGRKLKEWIKEPLIKLQEITKRHDAVEAFCQATDATFQLSQELKEVRDLERLIMRVSSGFATPRDLVALRKSLEKIAPIKQIVRTIQSELLFHCSQKLHEMSPLIQVLKQALMEEPAIRITEGNVIRDGFDAKLDELRALMQNGKDWLLSYQEKVRQETGIKTLKVSYNRVFGYYIEVSRGLAGLMPQSFDRKQTLANCERFISPELKIYETKVLTAEEEALKLEQELFLDLRTKTASYEQQIFEIAAAIAQIDVLLSLAIVAKKYRYTRPIMALGTHLEIEEGRHPVIEAVCEKSAFIPNDTKLDGADERMMLITGPNMAGKSTYIRQVALIAIMAQLGSFVPAKAARLGIVDQIFARIGASDDLSRGQSTFMVEMSETAHILNHATAHSLVILDEIGRGTSTYDGVAIAWAVAEYLLQLGAKTLFATHYWELTELEKTSLGCINYHAAVQEWNDQIVFLHKIAKGGTDRSYGIHVARLAGLPLSVISMATMILKKLEVKKESQRRLKKEAHESQLMLF